MRTENKVLIVQAQFYEQITHNLRSGAELELKKEEISSEIITVPGVFEIPAAINLLINSEGKY